MINQIKLPIKVESRNVLDRQHWAVKRRQKQNYQLLIRNQMRLNNVPKTTPQKYQLIITSYRKRLLDHDNLVGGCKHLIDALFNELFIWDDSPKFLSTPIIKQIKSNKEEFTFIERIPVENYN